MIVPLYSITSSQSCLGSLFVNTVKAVTIFVHNVCDKLPVPSVCKGYKDGLFTSAHWFFLTTPTCWLPFSPGSNKHVDYLSLHSNICNFFELHILICLHTVFVSVQTSSSLPLLAHWLSYWPPKICGKVWNHLQEFVASHPHARVYLSAWLKWKTVILASIMSIFELFEVLLKLKKHL